MTIISITHDVRITTSAQCTTIERRDTFESGKHAGESRWTDVGHYPSVVLAAKALITRHVHLFLGREAEVIIVKDIIDATDRGSRLIAQAIEKTRADVRPEVT